MNGIANDETDIRQALGYLVGDEPEFGLRVDRVVGEGRRLRRRHRAVRLGIPVAVLALVAAGGVTAITVAGDRGVATPALVEVVSTPAQAADPSSPPVLSPYLPMSRYDSALVDAVRTNSPAAWTFDFHDNSLETIAVDGSVDDGAGPGRLELSTTTRTNMVLVHPCADQAFSLGVSCTETKLASGALLSVRGLASYKGAEDISVVISRPDGTGVAATSANYVTPPLPAGRVPLKDLLKARVVLSRSHPTYSMPQLVALVKAVDSMSKDWPPLHRAARTK